MPPPPHAEAPPPSGAPSAARAAAARGPLSSQHMSATSAAKTWELPPPAGPPEDSTHAGGGRGQADAPPAAVAAAPAPAGLFGVLPSLGVAQELLLEGHHESEEKASPSEAPCPSNARQAQRACGPAQKTSQKGAEDEAPDLGEEALPWGLRPTPTIRAVTREAELPPMPAAAKSSSSAEVPPMELPGDRSIFGDGDLEPSALCRIGDAAPPSMPKPVAALGVAVSLPQLLPPPTSALPPAGTRSKARKKPGPRSSKASAPNGRPEGPASSKANRCTWMRRLPVPALLSNSPLAKKSRSVARSEGGLLLPQPLPPPPFPWPLLAPPQQSRAASDGDEAGATVESVGLLPVAAAPCGLPTSLRPPPSRHDDDNDADDEDVVEESLAAAAGVSRTRRAKSGTSTQEQATAPGGP
mmetsp:Transcript_145431/g.466021  ORF Transcript_145431/g.466021 Transcript_145431/m.466021 type:complete len:412 (-) Transcript_145431:1842-3077(-)